MPEAYETAFSALRAQHADSRFHLLDVQFDARPGRLAASGRVLDDAARTALREALNAYNLDDSAVQTLRRPENAVLHVAANLTDLLGGPSWLSERLSQLVAGQPLEILEMHDRWGYVRQADGYLGWAYLPYLTATAKLPPTHIVTAPVGLLRAAHSTGARIVGRALGGVHVQQLETSADWARVAVFDAEDSADVNPAQLSSGWLPLDALRPLEALPVTAAGIRAQMLRDAAAFVGVPYLWGGSSANGIDCSGFVQMLHAFAGITLPRDADLQFEAGRPVEPPYQPGDLLFYGEKGEQRKITHVSMSVGGWDIIHSSRRRNGVEYDNVQAVDGLRDTFAGARSFMPSE